VAYVEASRVRLVETPLGSMMLNGEKTILGGDEYVVLRLGDHLTGRFNASERGGICTVY